MTFDPEAHDFSMATPNDSNDTEMTPQTPSNKVLIQQGAEARVYRSHFFKKPTIIKERFIKSYRVPSLDQKLTHRRMNQEVRSMARCRRNGIRTPAVYHMDFKTRTIHMEDIVEGVPVKEFIRSTDQSCSEELLSGLVQTIGRILANMHDCDVIHGDLTTSNMIYSVGSGDLTLIDFGLSSVSGLAEDKGVDLYVLERAFLSTHPNTEDLFQVLLQSYSQAARNAKPVLAKLDEVRMRGRKRTMVG